MVKQRLESGEEVLGNSYCLLSPLAPRDCRPALYKPGNCEGEADLSRP